MSQYELRYLRHYVLVLHISSIARRLERYVVNKDVCTTRLLRVN